MPSSRKRHALPHAIPPRAEGRERHADTPHGASAEPGNGSAERLDRERRVRSRGWVRTLPGGPRGRRQDAEANVRMHAGEFDWAARLRWDRWRIAIGWDCRKSRAMENVLRGGRRGAVKLKVGGSVIAASIQYICISTESTS